MEQRDYLQKIIDQLGRVLGKILADLAGLVNEGKVSDGIEITNQALKNALDLDINELIELPSYKLLDTLVNKKKLSNENIEVIANILLLIADNLSEENDILKRKNFYEKCLLLFDYISQNTSTYSFDRHIKIEKIKNVL
jgi:hypothetical protein